MEMKAKWRIHYNIQNSVSNSKVLSPPCFTNTLGICGTITRGILSPDPFLELKDHASYSEHQSGPILFAFHISNPQARVKAILKAGLEGKALGNGKASPICPVGPRT